MADESLLSGLLEKDGRLRAIVSEIREASADVEKCKEELKLSKEVLSNLQDQLSRVAADDVQSQLPFPE